MAAPEPVAVRPTAQGAWRQRAGVWLVAAFVLLAWGLLMRELLERRPPDVAYVETPPEVVAAMVDLAEVGEGDLVYDLGCGDGRLAIAAVQRGQTIRAVGIDIDPDRVAQARENARHAGLDQRIVFRRADIFREDFSPATVIMMYLTTDVNARLLPRFQRLAPGTRIVSYTYGIPGVKPAKEVTVRSADGVEHRLLLWITPLTREP